ncbi:MAG: YibE/F family protein [Candidatus Pacebacteria bacterium]|nr:YibE/F family protein [Candidatus Paceibacterota bacterium]
MRFFKHTFLCLFLLMIIFPTYVGAQELVPDKTEVVKAEVLEVLDQTEEDILDTGVENIFQTIRIKILEGVQAGETITIKNDYMVLEAGDKFFLYHSVDATDGREMYSVRDIDRRPVMFFFIALFIAVVLLFSGKQGMRSLIGLAGSFFVILYVLIPGLLSGYPPVLTSTVVAATILFLAIYFTHGFNRVSTVAFTGTVFAVVLTGFLAYIGVSLAHFTGFATEEAFYLNLNTRGTLDFTGLLLGGIMIGVLGVLDDIAVTQAAVVRELYHSAPYLSRKEVYKKALNVGKEHVGALVNTLALAYTGASLPLLLLFSSNDTSMSNVINQEIFATEIIRTVVGSIGLILTVPITTLLAVYLLKGYKGKIIPNSHSGHFH